MEPNGTAANGLNSSHTRHLLARFQYADKLLGEIESILAAAASKSPFPKYKPDVTPQQAKLIQDYLARIRAQMMQVLRSLGIEAPEPPFGSLHSIRVMLGFAGISFDECRAAAMRGYGEFGPEAGAQLDGLAGEMKSLLGRLEAYLAQGSSQDLRSRLEELERAGGDVGLVKTLERIIDAHGMVEFRPALGNIVERMASPAFEIAVFGRVSSGKSSLLNRIVGRDILPVGVTPVTAAPTRIAYGAEERGMVWFADAAPKQFEVSRLAEYVSEEFNPGNGKHVSRIEVQLPSERLRDGVVYVDTPGLGSLARAGAAETMAYLPRCDLGVVLLDAGSTLTADDLSTIQVLSEAAIPVLVVLSKCDLLSEGDLERVRSYTAGHIASELGLNLPVSAVSAKCERSELLERWFGSEILPLYGRHAELARRSLQRKVGVLRAGVEAALRARMRNRGEGGEADVAALRDVEWELREAAGRFAGIRAEVFRMTDDIGASGWFAIEHAAQVVADDWREERGLPEDGGGRVIAAMEEFAAEQARGIAAALGRVVEELSGVLRRAAEVLGAPNAPDGDELSAVLSGMPRLDVGAFEVRVPRAGVFARWSRVWAVRRAKGVLRAQAGERAAVAFAQYGKQMEAWVRRTVAELEGRFDSYADAYRAQIERVTSRRSTTEEERETIRRDLETLEASLVGD
jgi:small GTP-binding protein